MTAADDLALLRLLVKEDAEGLRRTLMDPATDAGRFLRFTQRHRLGAFAYWTLARHGAVDLLPPPLRAAAKAAALLDRDRSERLVEEMRRLDDRFRSSGTPVLFLKGPLLAQRYYGSLNGRAVADLDILVPGARDLPRIERVLLEAGYEPAFRLLLGRRASQYFTHHFEFRRDGLPLDVHWAFQRHVSFNIDYRQVWATAVPVPLADHVYRALSDEYELVLQLLGIVMDLQVGKLALRSLVDVYRIVRALDGSLEWAGFFARRDQERILRPSAYALALVLEVLDAGRDCATLRSMLEARCQGLPPAGLGARAALASTPLDAAQKLLALRIYQSPLAASVGWWLVSLPFRLAVYGITRPPRGDV